MSTDYDAPRKSVEDDSDSLEELKERVPSQVSSFEGDEEDTLYDLGDNDLSDVDLDVVVVPQQDNEFTCVSCFLVRHRSQLDHEDELGSVCRECVS